MTWLGGKDKTPQFGVVRILFGCATVAQNVCSVGPNLSKKYGFCVFHKTGFFGRKDYKGRPLHLFSKFVTNFYNLVWKMTWLGGKTRPLNLGLLEFCLGARP
jgi:hypothetical protein